MGREGGWGSEAEVGVRIRDRSEDWNGEVVGNPGLAFEIKYEWELLASLICSGHF